MVGKVWILLFGFREDCNGEGIDVDREEYPRKDLNDYE